MQYCQAKRRHPGTRRRCSVLHVHHSAVDHEFSSNQSKGVPTLVIVIEVRIGYEGVTSSSSVSLPSSSSGSNACCSEVVSISAMENMTRILHTNPSSTWTIHTQTRHLLFVAKGTLKRHLIATRHFLNLHANLLTPTCQSTRSSTHIPCLFCLEHLQKLGYFLARRFLFVLDLFLESLGERRICCTQAR